MLQQQFLRSQDELLLSSMITATIDLLCCEDRDSHLNLLPSGSSEFVEEKESHSPGITRIRSTGASLLVHEPPRRHDRETIASL